MTTQNIKLTTPDNLRLDAVFTKVDNSTRGVIFVHGMTVDKDSEGTFMGVEPKLNQMGFSTLRFDLRGHGKSQGDPVKDFKISGVLIDIETAVKFMEQQGMTELNMCGASVGGGIAVLYVARCPDKIKKFFLLNPAMNYDKAFLNPTTPWAKKTFEKIFKQFKELGYAVLGSRGFKLGPEFFEEMKSLYPCEELKRYQGKLMIIHGSEDERLAYQDIEECFNTLPNPNKTLKIIQGARHGFHDEPYQSQVVEIILDFFRD